MELHRTVPGWGNPGARIVAIGEAGGRDEERMHQPFVGSSGRTLTRWLGLAGLQRQDLYLDNLVQRRPPDNKLKAVPPDEMRAWTEDLHQRLAALEDPWLIVPIGAAALTAITGKQGITKHRGSIYSYRDQRGRDIKVIPTVHPAATFRQPSATAGCIADWQRIAGDSQFRELRLPEREHYIRPTLEDLEWYQHEVFNSEAALAIDIETAPTSAWVEVIGKHKKDGTAGKVRQKRVYGEIRITCVGFALDANFSFTIPTTVEYWGSHKRLELAWAAVAWLCQSPNPKVLQNGHYDTYHLARERGIRLRNWRFDLKAMHHALDPNSQHDLAYMASVDTREPYWKDDCKDSDNLQKFVSDWDAYFVYNGKDAAVERELFDVYYQRLEAAGRLDFYYKHYRDLYSPLLDLSLAGLCVDTERRRELEQSLAADCAELRAKVTELAMVDLYGKKALSVKKLASYLYDTLRLPKQVDRKSGSTTTKEVVVRRLMLRYPTRLAEVGKLILEQRRKQQVRTFVSEGRVAPDGRFRSSYGFSPENGRLSSSKAPDGYGGNAQNQDREIREIFVADRCRACGGTRYLWVDQAWEHCEECFSSGSQVFLEVDCSLIEDRITKVLTKSPRLIERARLMPWENDEHRRSAAAIFKVTVKAVTKEQRYIGKRTRHGANYGLHGKKLAEELSKDGYTFTGDECEAMVQALHLADPEILDWHRAVRRKVLKDRTMRNSWGREIVYRYERFDDALYRRAYAWRPSSECADLLNQQGLVPLARAIHQGELPATINAHVHDSLRVSVSPAAAYDVAAFLRQSLEVEREYDGVTLSVPVEFKVGLAWGKNEVEWKWLPERAEFDQVVQELLEGK